MKRERNQVGRPSLLRHTNAHTVLQLLREVGSCSRADLVRASGLSAPTVTKVVADLLAANLIKPLGEGESSGGRPPNMISFKAERGCLLAVQITAHALIFLLADLSGIEMDQSEIPLTGKRTTPEAVCYLIGEEVRRLLARHKKARKQLLALVVAVPAIANIDEGIVISISTLDDWRAVPLRTLLNNVVDCLVLIENDTNLAALGERFKGAAQIEENFVLVSIGENVSAGIVLNGNIHHGAQWSAGEIGYLRLPGISRKNPALHEFGELEYILSSSGIAKSWRDSLHRASDAALKESETTAASVLDLAHAGDPHARKVIDSRAEILSDILVNLALILNPSLILLGGAIGRHPAMLGSVQSRLDQSEFPFTRIAAAALSEAGVLWGAIAIALDAIPLVLLPHPSS